MKIICASQNYGKHLSEATSASPVIFMKPDSALLKNNKPFFIPSFADIIDCSLNIVFRICKLGKNISPRFAHRYYDAVAIGIDFTARNLQQTLSEQGLPWELSKSFDGSAAISDFLPITTFTHPLAIPSHLTINGTTMQQGNTSTTQHSVDDIIAYVSRFCTLKTGDLIFISTTQTATPVSLNDTVEGYIGEQKLLEIRIK